MSAKQAKRATAAPQATPVAPGWVGLVEQQYLPIAAGLLALIAFFCFANLGQLPVQNWDEARHGISAYEMLQQGNFVVNTYQYQPDMWNLKPPLSFWAIALGYKLFGYNLFGMRFYSALAMLCCAAVCACFARHRYGKLEALLTLLFLAACAPLYQFHFARHADADTLFALLTVLSLLAMLLAETKPRAVWVCSLAFSLAFLTKSWHALFVPPVVFVYWLLRGVLRRLTLRQWVAFVAAGAVPLLLWFSLRFAQDGWTFFAEMVRVDLVNRTTTVLENHHGGPLSYFTRYMSWSLACGPVLLAAAGLYFMQDKPAFVAPQKPILRDLSGFLIWIFLPLVLFSFAQTQIGWYIIPLFFPSILAAAMLFGQLLRTGIMAAAYRTLGLAVIALVVLLGLRDCWLGIQPDHNDSLQNALVQQQDALADTKGKTVVMDASLVDHSPTLGRQSYTLLGELYYDWRCVDGTVADFLANPGDRLLLLSRAAYDEQAEALSAYAVVALGNSCLLSR